MENLTDYFARNITGKRIVITGSTTGIGKATAELMISLGARVVILGRDKQDFKNAFDDIKTKYPNCELYGAPADVSKKDDIAMIFNVIDSSLGGVDILINNAAISADGITKGSFDEWKYVFDTNVMGYLAFTSEAVSRMSRKGGHVVNVGSMSAEVREETGTVYVATKSAIRGFTASLRKEINPLGIKVSLIEPGAVSSDLQPGTKDEHKEKIERMEMLEAGDIAMSILFCLSQPKRCDIVSLQVRPLLQLI